MTEVRFYHLEKQNLDQALPALIARAYQNGHRIVVKTRDEQDAEHLNNHLWTYDPASFLPHGSKKDGNADQHPIWLTAEDENPNEADLLILTQATGSDKVSDYKLCCVMFDGRNPHIAQEARTLWASLKEQGHDLTYWQQGDKGWEKKSG
jgi:DNA polymerase-3 subunit chi